MNYKTKLTMVMAVALILTSVYSNAKDLPYPNEDIESYLQPKSGIHHRQASTNAEEVTAAKRDSQSGSSTSGASGYAKSFLAQQDSQSGLTDTWESPLDEIVTDLDRRIARQEVAIKQLYGWRQGIILGLFGFCALSLIYFYVRLFLLNTKHEQSALKQEVGIDRNKSKSISKRPVARSVTQTIDNNLPRVQFRSGVIDQLVKGINESRRQNGNVEIGYALVGKIVGHGNSRIIFVNGLIDEGPAAARSGGHHKADRDHQQCELELLQLTDGDAMYIGDAHLHPSSMDTCSSGDNQTDLGNVCESQTQEMVFVIVTATSAHWNRCSSDGVFKDGLKLNFFYLGKTSGYEYRRFKPEIVDGQILQAPASLRKFAKAKPVRTRLDFENLRRLTNYQMVISEMTGDNQQPCACIEMYHKKLGFKTIIAFGPEPDDCPEVFVETKGEIKLYQLQSVNDSWTDQIWFTPIVLEIEREITGQYRADCANHNKITTGERSTPESVKLSGPKGVHNHGKLSTIEQRASRRDQEGNVTVSIRRRRTGLQ